MKDLSVTLLQTRLHWEDAVANRDHFSAILENISDTDLIVLPEMFSTGFTMKPEKMAEEMNGPTVQWMLQTAAARKAVITGSVVIRENGNYYNRLIWAQPDGQMLSYNKHHLFRMAGEDKHYAGGEERLIVEVKGWRVCPLICYDLRFPVWSRNVSLKGGSTTPEFDLLLYVANWPAVRSHPWKSLLMARAIENQCFVAGVNRVGEDGNGMDHSGDSQLISPKGDILLEWEPGHSGVRSALISLDELQDFRERFPVSKDADRVSLTNF